ncbi:MAG: Hsp20/alpha crystallin family protein [Chloroflexota bacterium]
MMLRFDPVRGFEDIARTIGKAAGEIEKNMTANFYAFNPRTDISEDAEKITVTIELPGVAKEDVNVRVNDENVLAISGSKKKPTADEGKSWLRNERMFGEFARNFTLPEEADTENISARFTNGVLEVEIAKKQPAKPKEVNINID